MDEKFKSLIDEMKYKTSEQMGSSTYDCANKEHGIFMGQITQGDEVHNETILQEADRLVNSKRLQEYGAYADNAWKAIKIYAAMRGTTEVNSPADVALFQLAHKLGREMCRPKRDNVVDACGYLKLYYSEISGGK